MDVRPLGGSDWTPYGHRQPIDKTDASTVKPATLAGPRDVDSGDVRGAFEPYVIGDAGRAALHVVPRPDLEYSWLNDTVLDGVTIDDGFRRGALVVRAASVRGLSHRYSGKVRQDNYAFTVSHGGRYLVASVADGVSIGPESHTAAQIAVFDGVAALAERVEEVGPQDYDWDGLLCYLADQIEQTVRWGLDEAVNAAVTTSDVASQMATTVVFGVVDIEPGLDGNHKAYIVRLGDTSAWVIREGTTWESLGEIKDDTAVIADSATQALPLLPDRPPMVVTTSFGSGDVFVLMTDGVGDPLGTGQGEVGTVLAQEWATPPPPLQFAAQIDFARKSFDDDRTVFAVWPADS